MKLSTRIWQNVLVYGVCAATFTAVYLAAVPLLRILFGTA